MAPSDESREKYLMAILMDSYTLHDYCSICMTIAIYYLELHTEHLHPM